MKLKKMAVGLLALSLLAIAFASTVMAAAEYNVFFDATRQGNNLTFTITSQYSDQQFPGSAIDTAQITLVMLPRGEIEPNTVTYLVPATTVFTVTQYGVTFTLDRRDLPAKFVDKSWVNGYVSIAEIPHTFEATGPGWGWGNIH